MPKAKLALPIAQNLRIQGLTAETITTPIPVLIGYMLDMLPDPYLEHLVTHLYSIRYVCYCNSLGYVYVVISAYDLVKVGQFGQEEFHCGE